LTIQAVTAGRGLTVTADGTLYAADQNAGTGIWRSLNPTLGSAVAGVAACEFQPINNAAGFTGMGAAAQAIDLDVVNTATSNTLYVLDPATAVTGYGYTGTYLGFTDTMIVGPTLATPADKAQVSTQTTADVTWTAVTGVSAYQIQGNTLSTFAGTAQVINNGVTVGALTLVCSKTATATIGSNATGSTPLVAGNTYYWRVRSVSVDTAAVLNNINSRWSTVRSFITTLPSVAVITPQYPAMGATDVAVDATFTWAAVTGATSYDFVIAEELGNANKFQIIDFGDNTVFNAYKLKDPLKYNTQYWWEVRPISGSSVGAWTVGFFTTELAPTTTTTATATVPPVTPTVTVVNPTQPAPTVVVTVPPNTSPSTPVIPTYLLWAVIAVGAILVIAVIVLIVRTRRIS
jgi:hypothetical protein